MTEKLKKIKRSTLVFIPNNIETQKFFKLYSTPYYNKLTMTEKLNKINRNNRVFIFNNRETHNSSIFRSVQQKKSVLNSMLWVCQSYVCCLIIIY